MKQIFGRKSINEIGRLVLNVRGEENRSSAIVRYGVAAACVLVAFGIRYLLNPLLGLHSPFILFVPAIILAAWRGGIGPALTAIFATFLLVNYFFISPQMAWSPFGFPQLIAAATYLFSALVVVGFMNALRRERERSLAKARLLAEEVEQRQRIQEQLREREGRLRAILENSPTMIFLKDTAGRYLLSNREFEKITHKPGAEIIGKTDAEIFSPDQAISFCGNDLQVLKTEAPVECEEVALHDDGPHISIVHKFPLRDESGKLYAIGGIVTDITERKRAEVALHNSETRLRVLAETAVDAIVSADHLGKIIQFNRWAEKVFGYSVEEVLGRSITLLIPARFRGHCIKGIQQFSISGQGQLIGKTTEVIGLRKDGTEFPLELSLSAWETSEGKFFTAIIRDIAERKQTQEKLRQSEELLRIATQGARVGLWSWDIEHDTIKWNPVEYEQFGLPLNAEINLSVFMDCVHPDDRQKLKTAIKQSLVDGFELNLEHRILRPDGTVRWNQCKGQVTYANDKRAVFLGGMSLDITDRKHSEEALQRSETLLRTTSDAAGIGLWSWDVTHNLLEWNSIEYQQCAVPLNTKINFQMFLNCIHPEDRARVRWEMEKSLETNQDLDMQYRVLWPDDSVHWRHCKGRPAYSNGVPVRISGMSLDITARKQAEEALHRQAELLDLAQVLVFDLDGKILFWNRSAEKLYGWSKEDAIGQNCHQLFRTEFPEPLDQIKKELLDKNSWEGELTHFRKNGEKIFVASHWAVYKDAQNRSMAILESNNNITDLKKTEEALQEATDALGKHAEQLEKRVGRRTDQLQKSLKNMESFCYTIAHDLRAPLRAMSGFTQSLIEDYGPQLNVEGQRYCQRISAAANRMSQLISDLLVYGRLTHRQLPTQPVDLEKEIDKVLEFAAPQIKERHAEIEVDKPLPGVCGDAPVLDQVLENLITNAVKFVPEERRPHIHIYAEHHQNSVRLCIEDNGIGIPPEFQQKIFRPFERLQAASLYPGTGIGLAIVQRGIEQMGGHVGVESAPDQGSRFWIELPEQCGRLRDL